MDAWKKRVTRRADEFLIDFSRAIPPLSPGSLPFLSATTKREDRLDRISSEFVRKKKKRRVKDAHSRTWANFISRRRDPGGGQPIGIRLEDQLATIRRKSARIPRFKEGCGAFFSIISPSGIAFGKKQLGGLQPGRKSELPSFPVFMTSLIASQVAVGSATSFFALVPRHKLLPFVKHTSPSLPRDLLLWTYLDELRHRDTKFRKRESSSRRTPSRKMRMKRSCEGNDLILDGNQASK